MHIPDYIAIFVDVYNAGAALIIVFLIGHILFMMHRVDKSMLKAKLFLDEAATERTWMYISIAGASFALNSLLKFAVSFSVIGGILNAFYVLELTQLLFIVSFILAVYNWYIFIGSFTRHEVKKSQYDTIK